jgi:hypothetical protein
MDNQPNITDWLQLIFTIFGGCYAIYLLRQNNKEKKKQFLLELFNNFYGDKEIREVIYYVDSGPSDKSIKFKGSLEKQADKTIRYLDHVGQFVKDGLLDKKDIASYRYEIKRILENDEMKNYVKWLNDIGVKLDNIKYLQGEEN